MSKSFYDLLNEQIGHEDLPHPIIPFNGDLA